MFWVRSFHYIWVTLVILVDLVEFVVVEGVCDLFVQGHDFVCKVLEVSLDGVVKVLSWYWLRDLICIEVELEEVFFGYYIRGGDDAG